MRRSRKMQSELEFCTGCSSEPKSLCIETDEDQSHSSSHESCITCEKVIDIIRGNPELDLRKEIEGESVSTEEKHEYISFCRKHLILIKSFFVQKTKR
ncbi:uncharacterized protein LOC131561362 isoform X2 [Ammospiza caudacuta]|uniref:uncharacterized protein LOC131561362 isoform X2 n=1 Tax=Ammospiza caudacuta TaxID=2857398 RepID=UPI002738EC9B|nr:uncharacterized protein LOC131561362 isoform X2 [Ammospiza caudacuta]